MAERSIESADDLSDEDVERVIQHLGLSPQDNICAIDENNIVVACSQELDVSMFVDNVWQFAANFRKRVYRLIQPLL